VTIDICVQHGGREALRRAGLSAAANTCIFLGRSDIYGNICCDAARRAGSPATAELLVRTAMQHVTIFQST